MLRKFILETVVTIVVALLFVSTTDCWSVSGEENDEWPDPNVPPVWPDVFQVKFQEVLRVGSSDLALHNGSWYYNYPNRTARFDHGQGQLNRFCQGQGLSPEDRTAACQLLFPMSGEMWVIYPGTKRCCRMCHTGQGCSVLKPDWLDGGRFLGTSTIEGRQCAGWAKTGAVAEADTWYVDRQGVPCRYHEVVFDFFLHNLTFVPSTYSTAPLDPGLFQVPSYCQEKCPFPFPMK